MSDELNYEDDVKVDRDNLHIELEKTPSLIAKWRKEYGKAKALMDMLLEKHMVAKAEAKAEFEKRSAEIEYDLRETWDSHFDTKLTEKALSAQVLLSREYQKAVELYNRKLNDLAEKYADAVENKEILYGACSAMECRQPVLKDLVSLYLSGYYGSKPNVPAALEEQTNRGTSREIKKKLQRKKD